MKTVIRPRSEMKYSGIDLIGDMPQDWCICRLKNICRSFNSNITTNAVDKESGKYKIFGASGLNGYIGFETMENEYLGIVKDGAGVGRIDVYPPHSSLLGTLAYIIPNNSVNMKWLKYIIQNMNLGESVDKTTIPHIYFSTYGNNEIPCPPIKEQQAIADYLDNKCSKIDAIIAEEKVSIDEYKKLKQSVIFETVTKGLDKKAEMKDSGVEWIGKVSNSAVIKKIKYVSNISRGLFNYRPRNAEFLYGGTHPFIQTGDVARANKYLTEYKQTLSDEGTKVSKLFPKGTLTMTIAANVGDVSILGFDAYFPDSVLGISPIDKYSSQYLYYVLSSMKDEFVRVSISNTQENLNVERVKELFVPVFENSEYQKRIVDYLNDKCGCIDSLVTEKESLISDLEAYKKSLIYEVVTGKRRVV